MKNIIQPRDIPLEDFPAEPALPEGVRCVKLHDTYGPCGVDMKSLVYAQRDGESLYVHVLMPTEGDPNLPQKDYPCIVFIQGSAWHRQHVFEHMSVMLRACERGFAVALVQYRPSEVAPFPAQIQDAKTAIRFLRKSAKELRILPDKIALWGDSSGAHTAVMAGITGDGLLDTTLFYEYSAEVSCIVDWYGPTDISQMNLRPSVQNHFDADSPEGFLIERHNVLENPERVAKTVPMNYLSREKETPPILIMHGDRDQLVPFHQSCMLYEKLRELGKDVEMVKLLGAYHVIGGFLCDEALDMALAFIKKHLD
jgi:acetyl esterase/lipase